MKKRYLIAGIFTGLILHLTHHVWLGSHGDKHFDLMVMLIILICSFLLGLKLTSYLADFKDIKNKSRIEIIFLSVFFLFLVIPVLNINQSEKSVRENRMLATYQPLIQKDRINTKYGKDFENYFNDRFFLRQWLIKEYYSFFSSNVRYTHREGLTYINKKNNFIFTENIWDQNTNWIKPTVADFEQYKKTLDKLIKYSAKYNMELVIIAVPTKEKALIKYQDKNIKTFDKDYEKGFYIGEFVKKKYSNLIYIYPLERLSSHAGNDYMYYKTDHHYTDLGADIVLEEMINILNSKKYKLIKSNNYLSCITTKPLNTWTDKQINGSLYSRMHLNSDKFFDVNYKYIDIEKLKIDQNINNRISKKKYLNKNAINSYKVYVIGDSFVHSFGKCLACNFKNVIVRCDNISKRELYAEDLLNDIKKEKPEILIFVYASPHIDRYLKTFYYNRQRIR